MLVFKRVSYILIFIYLLIVVAKLFYVLHDSNRTTSMKTILKNSQDENQRIIIFGSSHCHNGLSAEEIQKELGIRTFNFCFQRWDVYEKNFLMLTESLNANDYLIYVKRIPFNKNDLKRPYKSIFLNSIFPNLYGEFSSVFLIDNFYSKKTNSNKYGDMIKFKNGNVNLPVKIKFDEASLIKYIKKQVNDVTKENYLPNLIFTHAPYGSNSKIEINYKNLSIDSKNNKFWFVPGINLNNKKYFMDNNHVNSLGRKVWTNYLIIQLKNIIK